MISVLYCVHLCMKYSLGISNFFEQISRLSHSIFFLYFFALISYNGFLISPCYSWNSVLDGYIFPFSPLLFASLLFSAICKTSSDSNDIGIIQPHITWPWCHSSVTLIQQKPGLSWWSSHRHTAQSNLWLSKYLLMRSIINDLSCYIIIIYLQNGTRARGHGAREPDHAILASLLFPYNWHQCPTPMLFKGQL